MATDWACSTENPFRWKVSAAKSDGVAGTEQLESIVFVVKGDDNDRKLCFLRFVRANTYLFFIVNLTIFRLLRGFAGRCFLLRGSVEKATSVETLFREIGDTLFNEKKRGIFHNEDGEIIRCEWE